jgi:hypothetical protein
MREGPTELVLEAEVFRERYKFPQTLDADCFPQRRCREIHRHDVQIRRNDPEKSLDLKRAD